LVLLGFLVAGSVADDELAGCKVKAETLRLNLPERWYNGRPLRITCI